MDVRNFICEVLGQCSQGAWKDQKYLNSDHVIQSLRHRLMLPGREGPWPCSPRVQTGQRERATMKGRLKEQLKKIQVSLQIS